MMKLTRYWSAETTHVIASGQARSQRLKPQAVQNFMICVSRHDKGQGGKASVGKLSDRTLNLAGKIVRKSLPTDRSSADKTSWLCCTQAVHKMETRVTRHAEGKTGKVFVGELSDENALDLAGKIVSEAFVYTVRSLLLW